MEGEKGRDLHFAISSCKPIFRDTFKFVKHRVDGIMYAKRRDVSKNLPVIQLPDAFRLLY